MIAGAFVTFQNLMVCRREWEAEAATLESRRAHMRRVEACVEARQRLGLDLLVAGELLALLRPLLYVMALRRSVPFSAHLCTAHVSCLSESCHQTLSVESTSVQGTTPVLVAKLSRSAHSFSPTGCQQYCLPPSPPPPLPPSLPSFLTHVGHEWVGRVGLCTWDAAGWLTLQCIMFCSSKHRYGRTDRSRKGARFDRCTCHDALKADGGTGHYESLEWLILPFGSASYLLYLPFVVVQGSHRNAQRQANLHQALGRVCCSLNTTEDARQCMQHEGMQNKEPQHGL